MKSQHLQPNMEFKIRLLTISTIVQRVVGFINIIVLEIKQETKKGP